MNNNQIQTIKQWLGSGSINIFGRPFAGKDTQGLKLGELFGGPLIGGGDIMRSHHDSALIDKIMASGDTVPSDLYLQIIVPYLSQDAYAGKPLILSAVGRAHGEEPIIIQATEHSGHPLKAVIVLNLSEEEVWKRFAESKVEQDRGNRADDTKEVLENRLAKYRSRTLPVLDYYRDQGLLIEVDGMLSREQVEQEILDALERLATPQ